MSFTGYRECVGLAGEYLMMMKAKVIRNSGVVMKTRAHAYHGDMNIMAKTLKLPHCAKMGQIFRF